MVDVVGTDRDKQMVTQPRRTSKIPPCPPASNRGVSECTQFTRSIRRRRWALTARITTWMGIYPKNRRGCAPKRTWKGPRRIKSIMDAIVWTLLTRTLIFVTLYPQHYHTCVPSPCVGVETTDGTGACDTLLVLTSVIIG